MKIKIKTEQLFRQGNDIRKHLIIDMPDYNREFYDDDNEIDRIIKDCTIYYNATTLPKYIELEVEEDDKHSNPLTQTVEWNELTTRPLNDEEKECFSATFTSIWDGHIPDVDEEVLVSDGKRVWTDTWFEYGDTVGFENSYDLETFYWMSCPEPPKGEKETQTY